SLSFFRLPISLLQRKRSKSSGPPAIPNNARSMKRLLVLAAILQCAVKLVAAEENRPVFRFAIVGLTHDHAGGFIPQTRQRRDGELVAVVEPNQQLRERYARRFQLDTNLFLNSVDELLARSNVSAVAIFTSTFEHRKVVEACAARGVHTMMEKPLAVNLEHARAMAAAAKKGGTHLIVNYETTWYPANQAAYSLVHQEHALGD